MTTQAPDLSIVVVSWNTRELLRRCLDSIAAAAGSLDVETIVVDNSSSDGSREMLRAEYPHVTLVENARNAGFGPANNQGAAYAHAPVLLLLNSDAAVLPGALEAITSFLAAHGDIGVVGLQLLNDDLTLQPSGKHFPTLTSTIIGMLPLPERLRAAYDRRRNARDFARSADVDEVSAAALAIRSGLFRRLGGFDPCFYFFGEDIDLCRRVKRDGDRVVYLPQAQAIHSWGGSRRRSPSIRHGLLSQRAQYLLLRRHRPRWQAALLLLYLVLFTTARAARAGVRAAGSASPPLHTVAHLYAQECRWLLRRNKCRREERPAPL